MNICRNCEEPFVGNYCPNCGQPAKLRKIDKHYVIQEIGDFLFAHRGMLYTIKQILIRPGKSVRQFIIEDRCRFVKPITFLFMTALIYALASNLFHIEAPLLYEGPESMIGLMLNWLKENLGYMHIIVGLFVAFWTKIFFRKSGYNLFEIFTFLCFVLGITTLFHSVVVIIQGITHLKLIQISIPIGVIYIIWAYGQFFDKKKAASYIKAFLSYILGLLTFGILGGFLSLIEISIKH